MSNEKKNLYRIRLGKWGEDCACRFLEEQGYLVVERNVRSPYGEIDIIVSKNEAIVFVEVKTRSSIDNGYPEEAITEGKIQHIEETLQWYLEKHPETGDNWRVDVVSVVGRPESKDSPKIDWWQNEF